MPEPSTHAPIGARRASAGRVIGLMVMLLVWASPWSGGGARADQAAAPGVIGYWTLQQNAGVVQIYTCGYRTLCGALVGIEFDHPTDPTPLAWNHRSQCDFVLIAGLRPRGDGWVGTITNPKNGHSYSVRLALQSPGVLAVRGYLLFSAFGRTQSWTRFPGTPPPGCRMTPADFGR